MQANCPQCSHRIVVDDAKVPDRAFQVKCPKCQNVVRFPGKAAAAAEPEPEPAAASPEPASGSEEMRAQVIAQLRREMHLPEGSPAAGRALVALTDKGQAGAMTLMLTRQGYQVDTLDDAAEGARLLEQGVYGVVVAARVAGQPGRESLYQRLNRLSPDARRRLFLILVGDELKTGDGTQAWACVADLVVNTKDAASSDSAFRNVHAERQRLYQVYVDARRRHEEAGA